MRIGTAFELGDFEQRFVELLAFGVSHIHRPTLKEKINSYLLVGVEHPPVGHVGVVRDSKPIDPFVALKLKVSPQILGKL